MTTLNQSVVEITKQTDSFQWTSALNLVSAVLGMFIAIIAFVIFCLIKQTGFFKAFSQMAFKGIRVRRNSQGKDSTPPSTPDASLSPSGSEHSNSPNGDSLDSPPAIDFVRRDATAPRLEILEQRGGQDSEEYQRDTETSKKGD